MSREWVLIASFKTQLPKNTWHNDRAVLPKLNVAEKIYPPPPHNLAIATTVMDDILREGQHNKIVCIE